MSHARERAEKICLNCNTQLFGRYCHKCGQENTDPRESIWSVITHFFNDITHFDGKFFRTVGLLVRKPGFLPLEYINGRRAGYLHPIRLYIFTSAFFFLLFYTFWNPGNINLDDGSEFYKEHGVPSREVKPGQIPSPTDLILNPLDTIAAVTKRELDYKSVAQYDSVQRTLPADERDGWLSSRVKKSFIMKSIKYGDRSQDLRQGIVDNFTHSFPYLLFVSLPICAFFLQLLYFRNKNNVYAGNAIFLVYLYVFTFIMLLLYLLLSNLQSAYKLGWIAWIKIALVLYITYYSAKAMKVYYQQGRGITIVKFIVYSFLSFVAIAILFVLFFLLSLLKV